MKDVGCASARTKTECERATRSKLEFTRDGFLLNRGNSGDPVCTWIKEFKELGKGYCGDKPSLPDHEEKKGYGIGVDQFGFSVHGDTEEERANKCAEKCKKEHIKGFTVYEPLQIGYCDDTDGLSWTGYDANTASEYSKAVYERNDYPDESVNYKTRENIRCPKGYVPSCHLTKGCICSKTFTNCTKWTDTTNASAKNFFTPDPNIGNCRCEETIANDINKQKTCSDKTWTDNFQYVRYNYNLFKYDHKGSCRSAYDKDASVPSDRDGVTLNSTSESGRATECANHCMGKPGIAGFSVKMTRPASCTDSSKITKEACEQSTHYWIHNDVWSKAKCISRDKNVDMKYHVSHSDKPSCESEKYGTWSADAYSCHCEKMHTVSTEYKPPTLLQRQDDDETFVKGGRCLSWKYAGKCVPIDSIQENAEKPEIMKGLHSHEIVRCSDKQSKQECISANAQNKNTGRNVCKWVPQAGNVEMTSNMSAGGYKKDSVTGSYVLSALNNVQRAEEKCNYKAFKRTKNQGF